MDLEIAPRPTSRGDKEAEQSIPDEVNHTGNTGQVTEPIPYTLFTKRERYCIIALVGVAGSFSTLSGFIYYPAISMIARDLGSTVTLINLTVTSYLIISGIAPALMGDASDNIGRRPIYFIILGVFILANVGIALQDSFVALLLLRMLQSAGISGMSPNSSLHRSYANTIWRDVCHRTWSDRRHCGSR